jgi:hypothetical protein
MKTNLNQQFFGLGRSRGRELEEIQDSYRRNLVGCVILSCEGTERGTLVYGFIAPSQG